MSTKNLCHKTCRIVFINMAAKSKFLLARQKMAQVVKMPPIVSHLARLIFTGQSIFFFRYDIPIVWLLFQSLLFVERFVF